MNRSGSLLIVLCLLWSAMAAVSRAQAPSAQRPVDSPGSDLPYPPAARPVAGEIDHVPTGLKMSFDAAMDMIAAARLVCVGETHDSLQAHRVELDIIRDLNRRFPGRIAIGMEMFREPQQQVLDRWVKGELTESEFLKATDWQHTWGLDFAYYRPILDFARDQHIDVVALNPPAPLQEQVRRSGLDALPADVRAKLPEIGEPDPYERSTMKAIYGGHLATEGMFESFFRVQLLWEESMAAKVADYFRSPRGRGKTMVTLTGGWHVRYGFGVPKKVLRRIAVPYVIVEPTEIEVPEDKQMDVDLPDIPLLPSDFVWWVPYETLPAPGRR